MSKQPQYSRDTEIRHVNNSDVRNLASILDLSSGINEGKKLMEIVPKTGVPNGSSVSMNERLKFNPQQIREIENSANLSHGEKLFTEIFLEEWGTMGLKGERPTVGLLLQLLIEAELWQGADYVALNFLNEPPPERPSVGPAARVNIDFSEEDFTDIGSMIYENYPPTEALNDNARNTGSHSTMGNNMDHLEKYQPTMKDITPKAPPRRKRLQQSQTVEANTAENIPQISLLNANTSSNTQSTYLSEQPTPSANIPTLTSSNEILEMKSTSANSSNISTKSDNLPLLSSLNVNGDASDGIAGETPRSSNHDSRNGDMDEEMPEHVPAVVNMLDGESRTEQTSHEDEEVDDEYEEEEEEEEDDDNILPNLSNLEQYSSNNESSLTTVTGTSGDNSFESTNSSSASNENIPCISALLP